MRWKNEELCGIFMEIGGEQNFKKMNQETAKRRVKYFKCKNATFRQ